MFYSDFLGSNLTIMTRFCDEKVPEHGHKGKMVSKWWDIILFYYYSTNAYFRHRLHLWVVTMGREMGRHLRCHTSQAYSMVYLFSNFSHSNKFLGSLPWPLQWPRPPPSFPPLSLPPWCIQQPPNPHLDLLIATETAVAARDWDMKCLEPQVSKQQFILSFGP